MTLLCCTVLKKDEFERRAWENNQFLIGVDEVGRGCLAGPLVAACCIIPIETTHPLLKDSKTLSELQREKAYAWLVKHAWFSCGIIDSYCIDQSSIVAATKKAMTRSINQLFTIISTKQKKNIAGIVVDAVQLEMQSFDGSIISFCHGEDYSSSIAAASIVAKVTRDRLMKNIDCVFPSYGFASHKGYGTVKHYAGIDTADISIIHRKTFLKNKYNII